MTNQAIYSLVLNNSYIFAGTGSGVWRLRYPETITNVENFKEAPAGFALEQNFPNPFNPINNHKIQPPIFQARRGFGGEVRIPQNLQSPW